MTGLEKILDEIKSESTTNAEKITTDANSQAQLIEKAANDEGEKLSAEIIRKAEKKKEDIEKRGVSSASLEKQKAMLVAKQQVMQEMINNSLSELKNLPDEKYFQVILKLISKNSLSSQGEIMFSKKDLARLPENFEEKINSQANGKLSLSEKTANISSGFVLVYGGIEVNCSFDAIFASKRDQLSDAISQLLFTE